MRGIRNTQPIVIRSTAGFACVSKSRFAPTLVNASLGRLGDQELGGAGHSRATMLRAQ